MNWIITDKETEDTKWCLGGQIYTEGYPNMKGYLIMGEYLAPANIYTGYDPKIFDTREELMNWMEELKTKLSMITPVELKDKFSNQLAYFQMRNKYPENSAFLTLKFTKEIYVFDFEDGFKVSCISHEGLKGEYTFKPFLVKKELI